MASTLFNNTSMVAQSTTTIILSNNNIGSITKFNNGLKLLNIATSAVIPAGTTSIPIPSGYHATSGTSYPFLGVNSSLQPRYATLISAGDTLNVTGSSAAGFYGHLWYY